MGIGTNEGREQSARISRGGRMNNVFICHTAKRDRTVVLVNGRVRMDSQKTLIMEEDELVDSFRRLGYSITIAHLPPQVN